MLIKVRQFLTKSESNPVPFRTMSLVSQTRETTKAIYVKLQGKPLPSSECVHCGREIKHPQSLHFGIGSTCIKHYPHLLASVNYDDIETSYEALKKEMSSITWEGWLPKAHIETIYEADPVNVVFEYNRQQYKVTTNKPEKLEEIKSKATKIIKIEAAAI